MMEPEFISRRGMEPGESIKPCVAAGLAPPVLTLRAVT
jgi:hypothetical protein